MCCVSLFISLLFSNAVWAVRHKQPEQQRPQGTLRWWRSYRFSPELAARTNTKFSPAGNKWQKQKSSKQYSPQCFKWFHKNVQKNSFLNVWWISHPSCFLWTCSKTLYHNVSLFHPGHSFSTLFPALAQAKRHCYVCVAAIMHFFVDPLSDESVSKRQIFKGPRRRRRRKNVFSCTLLPEKFFVTNESSYSSRATVLW